MHNFGMGAFYGKWLLDMLDVQATNSSEFNDCNKNNPIYPDCDGTVTDTTPHVPGLFGNRPADPSWGAALPLVSWGQWRYNFDGDMAGLRVQLAAVRRYVAWLGRVAAANPRRLPLFHWYGDWLEPQKVPSDEAVSEMVSAFNYVFGVRIARDLTAWVGDAAGAAALAAQFEEAARAFNAEFFNNATGLYGGGSQAEQVPALFLRIAPGAATDAVVAKALVDDILLARDSHLNTGIITTKWLFPALSHLGRADVGLAALLQRSDPSWGYMVAQNATTVWEHWNAYQNPSGDGMSSHNHPAFASVGAWLYSAVAGVKLDDSVGPLFQPAFRRVVLEPELLDFAPLPAARASVRSPAGDVRLSWRLRGSEGDGGDDGEDVGAGWRLVRRVAPGNRWHPARDQLNGTAVYDDGRGTFSRAFDDTAFDQFLFATGDMQKWLVAARGAIQRAPTAQEFQGSIVRSSISAAPYTAKWWHRGAAENPEDPWVSLVDYEVAIDSGDILYGESSFGGRQANATLPRHMGASVYIRNASAVVLALNATVPVGATAELRLAPFAAATAQNMIVRELGVPQGGGGDEGAAVVVWRNGQFVGSKATGVASGALNAAGAVCLELGSGSYRFETTTDPSISQATYV